MKNTIITEIKNILSYYDGLSFVNSDDSCDGLLIGISVDYIDTLTFSVNKYFEWEELLNSIDEIYPTFQFYCSYDTSGYMYWSNNMNESNHTFIDLWISDDFNIDTDMSQLINTLNNVVSKIDNFYFN